MSNGDELAEGACAPAEPAQHVNADRMAEPVDVEQPPRLDFPVVGIGGSAGGLEAFIDFFDAMPPDSGMAFVIIQHLPPDRESLIANILSKHTRMPVAQVEDGMAVKPDHVYVIRPGHTLTIENGKLLLGESLAKPGHNRPVDDFFKSLAKEQRERSIIIIMSGMGSNGSAGTEAIKAVGGMAIAQDPESAKYPSMPRHLMDSGNADFVLRPAEMPEVLLRYVTHPYVRGEVLAEAAGRREQQQIQDILAVLRTRTRRDFSGYKKPTVIRRIQRRMGLNQIVELGEYAKFLRQSTSEVAALSDDLMIHVTGFFRDQHAWNTLYEKAIVPLVAEREPEQEIRCWVAACSSGEEAYTLAMLLTEAAEAAGKSFDLKVFATDTADRTLFKARMGIYPLGIESEIAPQRLERFFDRDDAVYRIEKELREMVVFAPQNIIQDPPFSRLDIATCRNLLIYLEPELQRRVLALLHFGLREQGILFLGSSETVTGLEDMFATVDKRARIFQRIGNARHPAVEFAYPGASAGHGTRAERSAAAGSIAQLSNRMLLEQYTPAAVTVDQQGQLVFFHGSARKLTREVSVCAAQEVEISFMLRQTSCMTSRRLYEQEAHAHFITFGCYRRRRMLDHPLVRDTLIAIFADKLSAYAGVCSGFVIMPDHVHAIVWLPQPNQLSRFMKTWKQTSSLKLKGMLRGTVPNYASQIPKTDRFWQAKFYPFNLYSETKAREKLDYMHLNPVRAGLVQRAVDWRWSSARYYELGEAVGVPLEWIF